MSRTAGFAGDVRASLASARGALAAARSETALALLRGCEDWPIEIAEHAVLVKAEALVRRDADTALAWLAETQDVVATDAGRFLRELATASAYASAYRFDAAQSRLDRAGLLAALIPDGNVKLALEVARLRSLRGDARLDDPEIALALSASDPAGAVAAFAVQATIAAAAGDVAAQIAALCAALERAERAERAGDGYDVATVAAVISLLARLAFETADTAAAGIARRAHAGLAWTDDLRTDEFQTLRALGFDAFMHGDVARAQWLFHDAAAIAPSPAWRASAHLSRADVARIARNESWFLNELREAQRIAESIDWRAAANDERFVLASFATLLAPIDPIEAQRFATTYTMLGAAKITGPLGGPIDRRAAGFERYAQGRVEQTLGNRDAAAALIAEAYAIFTAIRHEYPALLAASALDELTGEALWADRMWAHAERYPGSSLAAPPAAGPPADAVLASLTPLQRGLARAHWSGDDLATCSTRFSRSRYTIERQLTQIYAAFGVHSMSGLRQQAERRGIA